MHFVSQHVAYSYYVKFLCADYYSAAVGSHNRFRSVAAGRRSAGADAEWPDCCLSADTASWHWHSATADSDHTASGAWYAGWSAFFSHPLLLASFYHTTLVVAWYMLWLVSQKLHKIDMLCCYYTLRRGGSRGVTRVTSHPPPAAAAYFMFSCPCPNSQTVKFHSPISPDPLNACSLRLLQFQKSPL